MAKDAKLLFAKSGVMIRVVAKDRHLLLKNEILKTTNATSQRNAAQPLEIVFFCYGILYVIFEWQNLRIFDRRKRH